MNDARHFLVVSHTGRQSALEATSEVRQLLAAGAVPVIAAEHWDDVHAFVPELNGVVKRFEEVDPARDRARRSCSAATARSSARPSSCASTRSPCSA